jgi:frataxin-like iron-binding protein CyaY
MSVLSEQEFRTKSVEALENARRALLPLADTGEGFEVELQNGVLNLVFEEPSEMKFVVSPNAPVRQIWVSAMARSYKLAWVPDLDAFALDGETLPLLLDRLAKEFLRQA